MLHAQALELHDLLRKRALLLLQRLDLLRLGQNELSLRLVDLELLLVCLVRRLELFLQRRVLISQVVCSLRALPEHLKLLTQMLNLGVLIGESVPFTCELIGRVSLRLELLFLELTGSFRPSLQRRLSYELRSLLSGLARRWLRSLLLL